MTTEELFKRTCCILQYMINHKMINQYNQRKFDQFYFGIQENIFNANQWYFPDFFQKKINSNPHYPNSVYVSFYSLFIKNHNDIFTQPIFYYQNQLFRFSSSELTEYSSLNYFFKIFGNFTPQDYFIKKRKIPLVQPISMSEIHNMMNINEERLRLLLFNHWNDI